jgi:hypothetical protein
MRSWGLNFLLKEKEKTSKKKERKIIETRKGGLKEEY